MMKVAPIIFAVALSLFMGAMAFSQSAPKLDKTIKMPLNFDGIDTLEIRSNQRVAVTISNSKPIELSYEESKTNAVEVDQKSNKMLIITNLENYYNVLNVTIPSSVKVLQTNTVEITSEEMLDSLKIYNADEVAWSGKAKKLQILDDKPLSLCGENRCQRRDVMINSGGVDELLLTMVEGGIHLSNSDQFQKINLTLGSEVSLTLSQASSMKNINLQAYSEEAYAPSK